MTKVKLMGAALAIAVVPIAASGTTTDCDLEVTRVRNADELVCYNQHGPKQAGYNAAVRGPLDICLAEVGALYLDARHQCVLSR